MDNSDFWRDLAEKFRTADPSGILSAEWHYSEEALAASPAMPKWHLAGPNQDQRTRSIQKDFDALARRGGPKIHPYMESLIGWLEALRESHLDGTIVAADNRTGIIMRVCQASADLCKLNESLALEMERMAEVQREVQVKAQQQQAYQAVLDENGPKPEAKLEAERSAERRALRDVYMTAFPEFFVLDICWAAKQHYREWMRWIDGRKVKDGSKPDRSFRAVLTSKKKPNEHRAEPRPKEWK